MFKNSIFFASPYKSNLTAIIYAPFKFTYCLKFIFIQTIRLRNSAQNIHLPKTLKLRCSIRIVNRRAGQWIPTMFIPFYIMIMRICMIF